MTINYKKIEADFNNHVTKNRYERDASLKVELTSFASKHLVGSGRNRVSKLLTLETLIIEAESMHIESSKGSLHVYINSNVEGQHGFGRYKPTLVKLRNAKGKLVTFSVREQWNHNEIEVGAFERVFGYDIAAALEPEEFAEYVERHQENVLKLADASTPEVEENDLKDLKRSFTKDYYQDLIRFELCDDRRETKRLNKLCDFTNQKLVSLYTYTHCFSMFNLQFTNVNSASIEFGYRTTETYNSLPVTLKISKVREIKTVKLADLGIEGAGYYSHDDCMTILPEQVKAAKAFDRRFEKAKRKAIETVLAPVKRKAA